MEQSIQFDRAGSTEEVIRQRRQRTILRKLRNSDLRKAAFLAVFLMLLFRCVFGVTFEYGSDMKPAIGDKDLLLYYRLQDSYTGGDVVVYEKRGVEMVGRIAAMPGETVEITKDGQLVINGYTQADINQEDMYNPGNENGTGKVTLKSQQYYILSDDHSILKSNDGEMRNLLSQPKVNANDWCVPEPLFSWLLSVKFEAIYPKPANGTAYHALSSR